MNDKTRTIDTPPLWEVLKIPPVFRPDSADRAYGKILAAGKPSKKQHLAWKILRDPFFGRAYLQLRSVKKIFAAGFFDDRAALQHKNILADPLWLATPIDKISKRLEKLSLRPGHAGKFAVLLTTGAFSPIHSGHIEMMNIARRELTKKGYIVLGGYISPSHDKYVSIKNRGEARLHVLHRLHMCRLALKNDDWLMVDPWEALHNDIAINYTDVIIRLRKYLAVHLKIKPAVEVIYIFGSDNAKFARAFMKTGHCACVLRPGYEKNFAGLKNDPDFNDRRIDLIATPTQGKDLSSASIRRGKLSGLDGEVKEYYRGLKNKKPIKPEKKSAYLIRQDSDWALKPWLDSRKSSGLEALYEKFLRNMASDLASAYRSDGKENLNFCLVDSRQQLEYVQAVRKKESTISLDVFCRGDYNFEISRAFALSDSQFRPESIVARPGRTDVERQLSEIPPGNHVLIEDDVASGATLDFVKKSLPKNRRIKKILILLDISKRVSLDGTKTNRMALYDLVDTRDFLAGSKDGGLVIILPDGRLARAPYMLPYVYLPSRAKLPVLSEVEFSEKLWALNEDFFKKIRPKIRLKHTDRAFQALMKYVGFKADTELEQICGWHKERLRLINKNYAEKV
jgi:nicotinate (nicotinamide) nucleotide adenylyltransferase